MHRNGRPILGKVIISGSMRCITGLHVGSSKEGLEIGGIDAAVVRDPVTRQPYIPGSSYKGKMRSMLERRYEKPFNRDSGQGNRRHECDDWQQAVDCQVCRVFGSTGRGREGDNHPGRLIVRDMRLTRESVAQLEKIDTGLRYTEWKFENTLDRVTSAAMPRQIERVPAGAEFEFEMIYNVENKDQAREDVLNIIQGLNLLEDDALGGHGSRGYGKVRFEIHSFEGRRIDYYAAESTEEQDQYTSRAEDREKLKTPEGRIEAVDHVLATILGEGDAS